MVETVVSELLTTAALTADEKNPKGCFLFFLLAVVIIIVWGLIQYYK